jgi:gliding motility-associated-like protein
MRAARPTALFTSVWLGLAAMAQCGSVISTFPYAEGFESDPAWTSGGIADDWDRGTPAHPLINSAGEGAKSWCVGGLTGQFYEFDAQSWLMSPCFDFSGLNSPWISFKIFWEVERTYDGMVLQYSLDQGTTWDNVGAFNDPDNCFDQNWYNTSNIINLDEANPKHGWSGRQGTTSGSCQGGQGSGGWITASHCLADLTGQPSVRFRFLFGSGSTCNNFDGVGIDDVHISEALPPEVETSFTCDGSDLSFSAIAPCATSILWDFGDPGSGAANSASGANAIHTYTGPGTYTVTTTTLGSCGPASSETFTVTVLGLQLTVTDATCGQPNGSLEAVISGGNGPFVLDWQPGGGTAQLYDGLAPGDYSLTVSGTDVCPITASGSVGNVGSSLIVDVSHTDVSCAELSDGTATAEVSGGTATAFLWSPIGGDQPQASGLPGGDYTVTVTGDNGCEVSTSVTIGEPEPLVLVMEPEVGLCAGATVTLEPEVSGGVGPYTFAWTTDGPDVSPVTTTAYDVTATDANGCVSNTGTTTVNVSAAIVPVLSVDEPSGCSAHCVQFTPGPAGMSSYSFDYGDGASGPDVAHCYVRPGLFDVALTVTDDIGCSGTAVFTAMVEALPTPTAGFITPVTVIITDGPLRVIDASSGGTQWLWDLDGADGDDSLQDPLVTFPEVGCYTLRQVATNGFGCSDTASAEVCVENEYALYAPNAFTPNGDGFNEVFGLVTSVRSPVFFEFRVFDRWGNEVFTTNDPDQGWTGVKAENGIYAWNVELRDSEHKLRKASGHVVLIR